MRVLAGLEALSELTEGSLSCAPTRSRSRGLPARPPHRPQITRTLSDKLGQGQTFTVNVRYDEALDPLGRSADAGGMRGDLNAALAKKKITFAPGSAEIEADARDRWTRWPTILRRCPDIAMEIAGHTDAQGGEDSNLALSQARAEAVLLACKGAACWSGALTAMGYGEARPIADNETEEGREANRRIEFTLLERRRHDCCTCSRRRDRRARWQY